MPASDHAAERKIVSDPVAVGLAVIVQDRLNPFPGVLTDEGFVSAMVRFSVEVEITAVESPTENRMQSALSYSFAAKSETFVPRFGLELIYRKIGGREELGEAGDNGASSGFGTITRLPASPSVFM